MRKKRTVAALTAVIATVCAVAFAAYLSELVYEGSHTANAGTGSAQSFPMEVTFNAGIHPGDGKQVNFHINNTTGKVEYGHKLEYTVTTSKPACLPSWFYLKGQTEEDEEQLAGTGSAPIAVGNAEWAPPTGGFVLWMKEEPGETQSPCEGAAITLAAKLHANGVSH